MRNNFAKIIKSVARFLSNSQASWNASAFTKGVSGVGIMCWRLNDLAETVVVNETQSLVKTSCVVPVISSHCAEFVPPTRQTNEQCSKSEPRRAIKDANYVHFENITTGWSFLRGEHSIDHLYASCYNPIQHILISATKQCAPIYW